MTIVERLVEPLQMSKHQRSSVQKNLMWNIWSEESNVLKAT